MKNQLNAIRSSFRFMLATFLGLFIFVSPLFAQPTEVNLSECNNAAFNGNYSQISSTCGPCTNYEKVGGGMLLHRDNIGFNLWNATTLGLNCAAQVYVVQSGESDCDPTNGGTSVNGCIINSGLAPLPVELLSFNARAIDKSIHLSWKVATELNNEGFEVERSIDGLNFIMLDFVKGRGNTTEFFEYDFADSEVVAEQVYYYRLRQVDFDGQFQYTEIETAQIRNDELSLSEFFPNPTSDLSSINITAQKQTSWSMRIFDLSGKLIFKEQGILSAGENTLAFNFSEFQTGLYSITFESSRSVFQRKLFIVAD